MILHVDGTTQPKTPILPEYVKAHVYLPPAFIAENPESHLSIARIVQTFIEDFGIPTIARWKKAAIALGWKLGQSGALPIINPSELPLVPTSATSSYIFSGRPFSSLGLSTAPSSSDEEVNLMERCAELEHDLRRINEDLARTKEELRVQ